MKTLLILTVATATTAFTNAVDKEIDIKNSTIEWKGKKVLGSHTGTIELKDGTLQMDGNQLIGGEFVVDMASITVTDLKGEDKGKLEGHLKSDDFFGVANHPTSTLVITKATPKDNGYQVTGDLTIKGITKPITFDMNMGDGMATAHLKIDRSKYNVRYGSGSFFDNLGDNAISDIFELNVSLAY